jgi:hypothetical protein
MALWIGDDHLEFHGTVAGFAEPAPRFANPPLLWGDEAYVHELFEGTGMDLEFCRTEAVLTAPQERTRSNGTTPGTTVWPGPRHTSSSPAASAADPSGRQGRETGVWRL